MTQPEAPDKQAGDVFTGGDLLQLLESIPPHVEGSTTIRIERIGNAAILHNIPITPAQLPRLFQIVDVDNDILLGQAVDDSRVTVAIAKPPELQKSVTNGTTLNGRKIVFDGGDSTGQTRTSTNATDSEDVREETVEPLYTTGEANSLVWALFVGDTGLVDSNGDPIPWLDVSVRDWVNVQGSDGKVRVSINDTTAEFLSVKLTAGDGITLTEQSDGANETLDISSFAQVKVSANDANRDFLLDKLGAGVGISVTETNDGGDETATIAFDPTTIALYDAGKQQVLVHTSGALAWLETDSC